MVSDVDSEELADFKTFTWDVVTFEDQELVIQIYFENPDNVGNFQSEDFILVTFYGVDFFKSQNKGVEVEFGKQLKHRIFRQVSEEDAKSV